ncbi:YeeE/YedE family protein [Leptothrix discophora]|uniref:YeeE/YedE family protein n=1 Tax=Leptothrix discophora TaxID=89 RepID=A0ABT9FZ46_LEPDI|nr:YeeE/YedE family protein [Leptothrix discophora]MDP4299500.1 YeeE/YedE family protein [Leptothrix discophora]
MQAIDVSVLTAQVLWAVFILAFAFGALGVRTQFCTMGAIADAVNFGDWRRLRMWMLAIGVAVLGFNLLVAKGHFVADQTLYGGNRWQWASAAVGGAMFGFGMVLSSGCGSRNLQRLGSGSLKALVVLVVMGLAAWMTLRGLTAVVRANTVDTLALTLSTSQDLPSVLGALMGGSRTTWAAVLGLLIGGGLMAWVLSAREGREAVVLAGGLGSGALLLGVWWVSLQFGHLAEHPETLEEAFLGTASRRGEALNFVGPVAQGLEWLVFFTDAGRRTTTGLVAVLGVFSGSLAVHLLRGEFRWEGFRDTADTARHLFGAVLMGIGGVTAMGCSIGQGLSGISTLGLTSMVALAAIVLGCVGGLRFLTWQLERSA